MEHRTPRTTEISPSTGFFNRVWNFFNTPTLPFRLHKEPGHLKSWHNINSKSRYTRTTKTLKNDEPLSKFGKNSRAGHGPSDLCRRLQEFQESRRGRPCRRGENQDRARSNP